LAIQLAHTPKKIKPSAAAMPSAAEKGKTPPTAVQSSTPTSRRKPSAVARQSVAEK
jgi:hypothetical protein